jgi:hypothetical protein
VDPSPRGFRGNSSGRGAEGGVAELGYRGLGSVATLVLRFLDVVVCCLGQVAWLASGRLGPTGGPGPGARALGWGNLVDTMIVSRLASLKSDDAGAISGCIR